MRSSNRSFKRFLLSYLILLLIPLLVGIYAYYETVKVLAEDAKNANLSVLSQTKETMDIRMKEVEQIATELAVNPKILRMRHLQPPFSDADYYQMYDVLQDVKQYNLNQFITDYYLHFPQSALLVTRRSTYHLPEDYGTFFRYGNLNYEAWLEAFQYDGRINKQHPAADLYYNGLNPEMMVYQKQIEPSYARERSGSVMIAYPKYELDKMLRHLVTEDSQAYIFDERKMLIYGPTDDQEGMLETIKATITERSTGYFSSKNDQGAWFVSFTTSSYNDWTYVALQPAAVVLSRANHIKQITGTLLGIALLLGMGYALWMSRRNSRPIRELLDTVKEFITGEQGKHGNELDLVQGTMRQLVHRHQHLQQAYEEQIPILKSAFFYRLFRGEFKDEQQLTTMAAPLKLTLDQGVYTVATLGFSGYDRQITPAMMAELNPLKMVAQRVLQHQCANVVYIQDTNDERLYVLLQAPQGIEVQTWRKMVEEELYGSREAIKEQTGHAAFIGVGSLCAQPHLIWKSYNDAERALEYTMRAEEALFWSDELPLESNLYIYPTDLEIRLINMVRAGNRSGVTEWFEHLESINFHARKLPDAVVRRLLYELNGTLLKLAEMIEDQPDAYTRWLLPLDGPESVYQLYEQLKTCFYEVCETIDQEKQKVSGKLLLRMRAYVEENYADPLISLASMAAHFQMSESYTSTLFKEHSGTTFSIYLETVRMKEACRLLEHTRESINDIAVAVGYSGDKAFRRAFKRIYGVLPTAYRSGHMADVGESS